MFENIPKQRLMLYFMLLGILPIAFVLFNFMSKANALDDLQNTIQDMQQSALVREKKEASNMAVRVHYKDADHFYIDKQLETLTFLEPEIEGLQKILNNKNVADDEAVKKRIETLMGQGNALVFTEGVVQSSPLLQETSETLVHPVEINGQDLQKILSKIEGIDIGAYTPGPNRPQMIIVDFKLDRKNNSEKNEVFLLNLKLIKREFS